MSRESDGILFSAVCGHCGECWDDHENPYQYGWTEDMMKQRQPGFKKSLYDCPGFQVRKIDLPDIILVSARRLFFGEPQLPVFWKYPGIKSAAEHCLKQNQAKWDSAERKQRWSMYSDCVVLIGVNPKTGTSVVVDCGS
ncbi:MAG: hypothetical protein LiPW30_262 [Parcubacteria group bacterium LiPW_30]|nr:MAG: hypothetical protein LiPW30_262 [Parcubacteria group bacterium LiPW_30]